jgi:hypothetical protein
VPNFILLPKGNITVSILSIINNGSNITVSILSIINNGGNIMIIKMIGEYEKSLVEFLYKYNNERR